jgi:hypothetical protein
VIGVGGGGGGVEGCEGGEVSFDVEAGEVHRSGESGEGLFEVDASGEVGCGAEKVG